MRLTKEKKSIIDRIKEKSINIIKILQKQLIVYLELFDVVVIEGGSGV